LDADRPAEFRIPGDNRPAPLLGTGLPFFEDAVCQMSFGERAALAGLLSALRPRTAVEVGTYEGGSLRVLAAFSDRVHTIDLFDLVPDRDHYRNVSFHTGDSAVELPALLAELTRAGTAVDFALIDGDHSSDGVHRDLLAVLDSPAARSAVIVLHDTMNPEVRAGIERAGLSERPTVVYYELDFVPGYEFAGGHFDGQVWGGLGLVVTGDRAASGYGDSPAQARYREPFGLLHDARSQADALAAARRELEGKQAELRRSRELVSALEASLSWRVTAPLRAAKKRALARRGR
jgi:hypothetical protein